MRASTILKIVLALTALPLRCGDLVDAFPCSITRASKFTSIFPRIDTILPAHPEPAVNPRPPETEPKLGPGTEGPGTGTESPGGGTKDPGESSTGDSDTSLPHAPDSSNSDKKPPATSGGSIHPADGPDPDVPEHPVTGCATAKRGLARRCEPWDSVHDQLVADAQKKPGVKDDDALLTAYRVAGAAHKLEMQPERPNHLNEIETKFGKGYKTDVDLKDNSLLTGLSGESGIQILLKRMNDPIIDLDGTTYSDFKSYSLLREPPPGKNSNPYSTQYTARSKIGTGNDHVMLIAEDNHAKLDNNRYLNPADLTETRDSVYNNQALKNYDLAFMHLSKQLGGISNSKRIATKFVYIVRESIANDNTNAFILRLFQKRNVNLDGKITLSRFEENESRDFARSIMLDNVYSTNLMRCSYPEVFGKDGGRRIEEITFFGPTNKFKPPEQGGHPASIIIKWGWSAPQR